MEDLRTQIIDLIEDGASEWSGVGLAEAADRILSIILDPPDEVVEKMARAAARSYEERHATPGLTKQWQTDALVEDGWRGWVSDIRAALKARAG